MGANNGITHWLWRQTIHKDYDDFSQAYIPHIDKKHGILMSLNLGAEKMNDTIEYKVYSLKDFPVTEKSKKISKLLRLSKLPIIRRRYLKEIPKLFIHAKNVEIAPGFYCKYGNIDAEDVYLYHTFCLDYGLIKIGRHTTFSFDVAILTTNHDLDDFNKIIVKPVIIGENVRIEFRVVILAGVTIGDNSVIGAGSVVTRDIPSGVLAAGAPCKVIRRIDRGKTKWWES